MPYLFSTDSQLIRLTSLSYTVTELLGTDLHRLLTSRPLEKQFIQYFCTRSWFVLLDNGILDYD